MAPDEGEMACGEYGPGRLPEPAAIKQAIDEALAHAPASVPLTGQPDFAPSRHRPLSSRPIPVTAGPTHEPIDPVSSIAHRSSGKHRKTGTSTCRENVCQDGINREGARTL